MDIILKQKEAVDVMQLASLDDIARYNAIETEERSKVRLLLEQQNTKMFELTELTAIQNIEMSELKELSVAQNVKMTELSELTAVQSAEEFTYPFPPDLLYQYKEVAAGETETIWTMDLRESDVLMAPYYVGVITLVANSWYDDTLLTWKIDTDGEATEPVRMVNRTVEEALGAMDTPLELKPRYIITHRCEWTATNNDSTAHVFWVYQRGYFILKETYKKIAGILVG